MTMLQEAFRPDEVAAPGAQGRARAALLERIHPGPRVRGLRWPIRVGLAAAIATAAVVSVVVIENVGTVGEQGSVDAPPFGQAAAAAEFLENAAVAASRKSWTAPRPDQFMYKESHVLRNDKELETREPNGPLVPGRTRVVVEQDWKRIDAQVWGRMDGGKLVVERQGERVSWGQVPYADLAKLTTPDKVLAWDKAPKNFGVTLDALPGQYVLPPEVEAAFFRALAQREGMRMNPEAVNIDGRPAVGLGITLEGYLSQELLFDKETYALIGERLVAIADHTNVGNDGTSYSRKGDLFRQVVYTNSLIVGKVGDTK